MKLTAEISMYPLADNYILAIDGFIRHLNQQAEITVITTPTCTQINGDYDLVFAFIQQGIKQSHAEFGRAVFVTKFIADHQL
ncbi:MAG: YkoF family thiamine/hydroxymethylpyrimidine-binding protein [Arenicellaceae bacterium]|nr:YkoF family thiamine/hydroxymethylpyrimidine-binding protein [Arenicellaceae bacterium]